MAVALSRFSCSDIYTDAGTLIQPGSIRVTFFVSNNNSVIMQFADEKIPFMWNGPEVERTPGHYSLDRKCGGVRVKNSVAGKIAIITLELLLPDDVSDI